MELAESNRTRPPALSRTPSACRVIGLFPALLFLTLFALEAAASASLDSVPYVRPQPSGPRARVVIAQNPDAVAAFNADWQRVEALVNTGLLAFTGQTSREAAWRSLVSTQDVIGIKVVSGPGGSSGTRPAVVAALASGLLAAGVPPENVILWDKQLSGLRRAGFVALADRLGIRAAGAADEGYDGDVFYDAALLGNLVWGDHEFGKKGYETTGRRSYLSRLVTQKITRIINVTPMLNHNLAGVAGCLFSLTMDSVDNTMRFENSPEHLAQAVPELYALEALGDKVALNIVDALLCQYQGEERTLLHYSVMLGEIRFSADPVALDTLSIQEIARQRAAAKADAPKPNLKIYSNCALLELGVNDTNRIETVRVR